MEINKINENQIRITISNDELLEKNINISELDYSSDQSRKVFQELLEEVSLNYDFRLEGVPLIVEVTPNSKNFLDITVTKVTNPEEIAKRFSSFLPNLKNIESAISESVGEFLDIYAKELENGNDGVIEMTRVHKLPRTNDSTKPLSDNKELVNALRKSLAKNYIMVYSFKDLDTIVNVSKRLSDGFNSKSSAYKYDNNFYLVIENSREKKPTNILYELVLSEYGEKQKATYLTKTFLSEHGEKFIKANAVEILSAYL